MTVSPNPNDLVFFLFGADFSTGGRVLIDIVEPKAKARGYFFKSMRRAVLDGFATHFVVETTGKAPAYRREFWGRDL